MDYDDFCFEAISCVFVNVIIPWLWSSLICSWVEWHLQNYGFDTYLGYVIYYYVHDESVVMCLCIRKCTLRTCWWTYSSDHSCTGYLVWIESWALGLGLYYTLRPWVVRLGEVAIILLYKPTTSTSLGRVGSVRTELHPYASEPETKWALVEPHPNKTMPHELAPTITHQLSFMSSINQSNQHNNQRNLV